MTRLLLGLVVIAIVGGAVVFYFLTAPQLHGVDMLPRHQPDLKNGQVMFTAGGCASCHAAPASEKCDDPKSKEERLLVGGRCLKTKFGTFVVPNISSDKQTGIGGWSDLDFVNAMVKGVSPEGEHYYPAFPYTSYQRMRVEDLLDLKAYIDSLPAGKGQASSHELSFPFNFRRGLGFWKILFLDGRSFEADKNKSPEINRGAYLVSGPGHCGECHSPRNFLGGFIAGLSYSGARAPEGKGAIPNITPHKNGIGDWSVSDIDYAFESGLTPSFDTFGGSMVAVQKNLSRLSKSDRQAIAKYLLSLPPIEGRKK